MKTMCRREAQTLNPKPWACVLCAGPVLGPLFADPSTVKVLHGSDHDIL